MPTPFPVKICRICEDEFELRPTHQGFANVCPACTTGDVDRLVAKVAWSGKHTIEIEITADTQAAERFNRSQRRTFAGPLRSIIQGKEGNIGKESGKYGSGAEGGALYRSSLGEKRTVKR